MTNETETPDRVETREWEQHPDRPEGYVRVKRVKTIGEVMAELRDRVGAYPEGGEEYFAVVGALHHDDPWPDGDIITFAVEGDSEGHYVHVHVVEPQTGWQQHRYVLVAKTFAGADAAWAFARRLYNTLDAG